MSVHYKELSDRAFSYHNSGEYDKAKELYLQLLAINPDDPNILNLLGMLYLSLKDTENGIKYISKAFLLKQSSYIATNLAKAYILNKDYNNALKFFNMALSYGESYDLYYSLGYTYKKLGRIDEAINYYKKAIAVNPNHYNSLFNLSIAYSDKNDMDNAIFYAELCKQIKDNDDIYAMLSEYYQKKNLMDLSIEFIKKAISFNDKNYLYFYNLGVLYIKKRNYVLNTTLYNILSFFDLMDKKLVFLILIELLSNLYKLESEALNSYKNSVKINVHHTNSYINIANILRLHNKIHNCINILNLLLKVNPNCNTVYGMLAVCYMDICDYENAHINYNKAIDVSGKDITFLKGKAAALRYSGKYEEAKKIYLEIKKDYPNDISSKISLGMCYLCEKNFKKGYELYRYRSTETSFQKQFKKKIWNKRISLENKNILLYTDCGFGDSIMFSRYINYLSQIAQSITLQTDEELIKLFKENFKDINIIKKGQESGKYDVVMPLMDIQYALDMDFTSIPYSNGYLKAQNNNILKSDKQKIGLYWKGSDKVIKNRSIPFEIISKLTDINKYDYYSFQIDAEADNIINLNKYINDMYDSANLLSEMDLLITIDSSVAHLAGALGIKTWLLLPYVSEWRWFNDNKTTPWYDSIRIFKQDKLNDWDSVIEKVKAELEIL